MLFLRPTHLGRLKKSVLTVIDTLHGTTWPTFRSARRARQQIKIKWCFIFQPFQRLCSTQRIQTATNSLQFPFFILKVKGHKISNQNVGIGVPDRESVGNWDQHPHGSLVKSCKDTIQPLRIAVSNERHGDSERLYRVFACGMACSSVSTVLNNVRKTGKGKWTQSVTLWDHPTDGAVQRRRYGSCSRTVVENDHRFQPQSDCSFSDEPKRRMLL